MLDRTTQLLLLLYPEPFRERFGPQIEADLYHPDSNRAYALFDIVRTAFVYRVKSPGLYIWTAACGMALGMIAFASATVPRWIPGFESDLALYTLLFSAVLFVLFATLFLAVYWLQCSKSKI